MKPISAVLLAMIRIYQLVLSPWIGNSCRYQPSCSNYAMEAIRLHGPIRGLWLGARRLGRCHPWGGSGYDPVPAPRQWHRRLSAADPPPSDR